jgi:arylsulfatase A-like enzyme
VSNYEAPAKWVPATLTANQVREVNALNAVEVELIDEAIGRVMKAIEARGWGEDVDVIFTTDHGEFQGDFGFLFKGPYHVDALMRLPLIWRPARSTRPEASVVSAPVSLVSLAATFLEVAGHSPRRRGWRALHCQSTTTPTPAPSVPRSPNGTRPSSASTCTFERSSRAITSAASTAPEHFTMAARANFTICATTPSSA